MKRIVIICLSFLGLLIQEAAQAQQEGGVNNALRIGGAYFGENLTHPGMVLEIEYDRAYSPVFSLPFRSTLGYHINEGYHAFFLDVQKGYRKSFSSGFFLEQSLGAGLMLKRYRTDYWYRDAYFNSIPHGNKPVASLMPSAIFGAGYDLSGEKDKSSLVWIRPKIYWDLGFRGLHQPYFAIQVGYSHTFKTL